MYIYKIGYGSYEESEFIELSHKEKFSKLEMEEWYTKAFEWAILEKKKDPEATYYSFTFQHLLSLAADWLVTQGFSRVVYESITSTFGWANTLNPRSWEDSSASTLTGKLQEKFQKHATPEILDTDKHWD